MTTLAELTTTGTKQSLINTIWIGELLIRQKELQEEQTQMAFQFCVEEELLQSKLNAIDHSLQSLRTGKWIPETVPKPKKKIIKIKPKPTKEEDNLYSPRAYEIIEKFMLKHNVYEDRLKAHFREGEIRDGVWFNIWDEDSEDVD